MGFNDRYISVFNVLNQLGLLSGDAVDVEGVPVVPLKLLKAVLPDPASLAAGYEGQGVHWMPGQGTKPGQGAGGIHLHLL